MEFIMQQKLSCVYKKHVIYTIGYMFKPTDNGILNCFIQKLKEVHKFENKPASLCSLTQLQKYPYCVH